MKYGQIPGCDKRIGRIVQGTIMLHDGNREAAHSLLDGLYELGCNAVDAAHNYGGGGSERSLGLWMESRGVRDEMFVLTKGCHFNQDRDRVTPYDLSSDLHDSLVRLRTDYIDLYLLHRDNPALPVGPLVDRLDQHRREGKILAYGGSNWSPERIREANAYADANGCAPFVASSPNFSMAEQVEEPWRDCLTISGRKGAEARAWYLETQMPVFTWSSLAMGFFTGIYTRDNLDGFEGYHHATCIRSYVSEENFRRLDRAAAMGSRHGLTSAQVAVAYVLSQPLNLFALIGCNSPAEWQDNLRSLDFELTPADLAWLETGAGEPTH